jgi:hypothetical protein
LQKPFQQYLAELAAAIVPADAAAREKRWLPVIKNAAAFNDRLKECAKVEQSYIALFMPIQQKLQDEGKTELEAREAVAILSEAYRSSGFTNAGNVTKLLTAEPFAGLDKALLVDLESKVLQNRDLLKSNEQSYRRVKDAIAMLLMTTKEYEFMVGESAGHAPKKEFYEHL